jgi:hypothetical protein
MCTRYVFTDPAEAIRDLFRTDGPLRNSGRVPRLNTRNSFAGQQAGQAILP